jgi:hypothetical protein
MSEIKGVGDSAYIAQVHSPAPRHLVEAELAKLLTLLVEDGLAVASRLSETPVPNVETSCGFRSLLPRTRRGSRYTHQRRAPALHFTLNQHKIVPEGLDPTRHALEDMAIEADRDRNPAVCWASLPVRAGRFS